MIINKQNQSPNDPTPPWGDGYPPCEKCKRPVDSIEVEKPFDTGERIYTINCHGETWRWSNFRGAFEGQDTKKPRPAEAERGMVKQ
jgi:hypothetical protein